MTTRRTVLALLAALALAALATSTAFAGEGLRFTSPPELYAKGRVSTEFSEIKVTFSPDGTSLLFATDGRGGKGLHDLFVASQVKGAWQEPKPLVEVNGPDEDFDGAFLSDGHTLVFTRRTKDQDGADLFVAPWRDGHYAAPQRLGPEVNAEKSWNLGPAVNPGEPGVLFFSSHRSENTAGRLDIYRIGYEVAATVAVFAEELAGYDTSKGTIRFPADRPPPAALVRKIVRARIAENEAAAAKRTDSASAFARRSEVPDR